MSERNSERPAGTTAKVADGETITVLRKREGKLVAVALLIAAMTPDSKAAMVRIKREDLLPDHTGMADFIRHHFGLWEGNTTLIESCGRDNPDDAAVAIIEMTWKALRATLADAR
jgi:hypothetical protein